MKQCENGHFYDGDEYSECPYCSASKFTDMSITRGRKTNQKDKENNQGQRYVTGHMVIKGRYQIVSRLGEGASSTVYHAHDTATDRDVVLKAFHTGPGDLSIARIQREAKLYGRIDHPLIAQLYDIFVDKSRPYLVFSYEPGTPLDKILMTGPLAISRAYRYACNIFEGLEYLHSQNIIHRDIKPSNILILQETDRAIISDLGIGKPTGVLTSDEDLTQAGELIGTPLYMAPEVMADEKASAASDVYSAGVVIFEMLTGRLPFSAHNLIALADKVRSEPLPQIASFRPAVPESLVELVNTALSKERAVRPSAGKAFEVLRDMETLNWMEIDVKDEQLGYRQATRPTIPPLPDSTLFSTQIEDREDLQIKGFLAEEIRAQMEHAKLSADLFERRSKVWLGILGRESVATIVGAVLLLILVFTEVVALLVGKDVPEILDNSLLIILGYFFGQTASRAGRKESE